MPAKNGFNFHGAFPDPDPAYDKWEPDPDTIPKAGVHRDFRFDRDQHHETGLSGIACDAQAVNVDSLVGATDMSIKSYDINVGTVVDLSKGWPVPEVRASGPPRNPKLRCFTQDVHAPSSVVPTCDGGSYTQEGSQYSSQQGPDTGTLVDQLRKVSLGDDEDRDRDWKLARRVETVQARDCDENDLNMVSSNQSTLLPNQSRIDMSGPTNQEWDRTVHIQEVLRWEENMKYQHRITESGLRAMTTGGFKRYYDQVRDLYRKHADDEDSKYFLKLSQDAQADLAVERFGGYGLNDRKAPVVINEDEDAELARELEIAEALDCDVNNLEMALWDQHRLLDDHAMEHNCLTVEQYTRKHRIDEMMTWELALGINKEQRLTEPDLMAMDIDEFERCFSKTQEAYQIWAAAENFERYKFKDQKNFGDFTKAVTKRLECHELKVAAYNLIDFSDEDGELHVSESDDDDGEHTKDEDGDNKLSWLKRRILDGHY